MNEILFRGKRAYDSGGWIYGGYHKNDAGKVFIIIGSFPDRKIGWAFVEVIPESVGQYTGIKDKNGKEIFSRDYIKIPDDWDEYGFNAGEVYEVYFAFGGFRCKPKYNTKAKGFYLEDDKIEIIGNSADNPELMK